MSRPSFVSHAARVEPAANTAPSARNLPYRRRRMGPERRARPPHFTAGSGPCASRNETAGHERVGMSAQALSVTSVPAPLTLLTVHAHPDDEASKGAATVAKYHAEGVTTVLVCCTGGEEGDLQNPGLREPGQPFHGVVARRGEGEAGRAAAARARRVGAHHRVRPRRDARLSRLRAWPDSPTNEHPDSFHQADIDEAAGRLVEVIRRSAPAGRAHVRRRPARLPAPRPPSGSRRLRAGVRPGRRSRLVSRPRRAVPAREALLLRVVAGTHGRRAPGADREARQVTVRREVVRPPRPRRPDHHPDRDRRLPVGAQRRAQGACAPRSTRTSRGGSGSTTTS